MREGETPADAPLGLARELADQLAVRGLVMRDAPRPVAVEEPDERAALEDASRAYTALHPALARQLLDALFARADARGTAGLDEASVARAFFLLALAAQATGDEAAADAALDRLLVVDPTVDADAATYPPPLCERLELRRALVTALPLVVLHVATVPGAVVEVDGRALEPGATLVRVVPGPHLVRARAPSYLPSGQRVEVRADPTDFVLSLALDPGAVLAVPGPPTDPPAEALVSVARTLDATLLLVDVIRAPTGLAIDVRDLSSSRRAHLVAPRALTAHALAVRIAAALLAPPSTPRVPAPRGPVVWPWLVAAGAVVVGAVVLGVALSVNTEPGGFVLVPETP